MTLTRRPAAEQIVGEVLLADLTSLALPSVAHLPELGRPQIGRTDVLTLVEEFASLGATPAAAPAVAPVARAGDVTARSGTTLPAVLSSVPGRGTRRSSGERAAFDDDLTEDGNNEGRSGSVGCGRIVLGIRVRRLPLRR